MDATRSVAGDPGASPRQVRREQRRSLGEPKQQQAPVDDEMAEIEALLKKRGIS